MNSCLASDGTVLLPLPDGSSSPRELSRRLQVRRGRGLLDRRDHRADETVEIVVVRRGSASRRPISAAPTPVLAADGSPSRARLAFAGRWQLRCSFTLGPRPRGLTVRMGSPVRRRGRQSRSVHRPAHPAADGAAGAWPPTAVRGRRRGTAAESRRRPGVFELSGASLRRLWAPIRLRISSPGPDDSALDACGGGQLASRS